MSILSVGLERSIKSSWFDWVRKSDLTNFSRKCFALDWVRQSSITEQLEWLRRKLQGGQTKVHSSALQVCNAVRLVWMSKSFTAVTTSTRPRMFLFLSGWNLSFRGRQSTVSMVFSRALTEKVPSSLNEGRRKSTRIISHDDHAFNFIYLIKMKDYIANNEVSASWVSSGHRQFCLMSSWHNSWELIPAPKFCPSFFVYGCLVPWVPVPLKEDRRSFQSNLVPRVSHE